MCVLCMVLAYVSCGCSHELGPCCHCDVKPHVWHHRLEAQLEASTSCQQQLVSDLEGALARGGRQLRGAVQGALAAHRARVEASVVPFAASALTNAGASDRSAGGADGGSGNVAPPGKTQSRLMI